jgi:glycosyltransferase involved in cell wall biosynthesis
MLKVSVVIPLYNHGAYIEQAVSSVMDQTMPVHELIVVDDGSTDLSVSVMKTLCERYPQLVFWSQPNQGAHQAINSGIHRATGDLVTILNSDDVYHPERMEACVCSFIEDPKVQAVATGIEFMNDVSKSVENGWYAQALDFYKKIGDLGLALVNGNFIMTTSNIVVRRTVFNDIGYFSSLRYTHDLDFFLRMLTEGMKVCLLDKPLMRYRMHSSNTISENHNRVRIEWAAVAARYLVSLQGRFGSPELPWKHLETYMDIIERHSLARLVLYFATYFQKNSLLAAKDVGLFLKDADFYALAKGKVL